jgi:hypothetical protein
MDGTKLVQELKEADNPENLISIDFNRPLAEYQKFGSARYDFQFDYQNMWRITFMNETHVGN